MLAGQAVIVPGALNQALAAVSKVVPLVTVSAVVSAFWGRKP
jgi:hypothetical protein